MSLLEAPGAKAQWRVHQFPAILCMMVALIVLLIYDYFNKPTFVKQVVLAAIVFLSNACHAWPMDLRMNLSKFVLDTPCASIL